VVELPRIFGHFEVGELATASAMFSGGSVCIFKLALDNLTILVGESMILIRLKEVVV
jgi:hypothetical protein